MKIIMKLTIMLAAVAVMAMASDARADVGPKGAVQLWEGGPYWATTNIGAEKPEDYGYYFWWGDTTGHRPSEGGDFSLSFYSNTSAIHTYFMSDAQLQSAGCVTSSSVLTPSHDAAHVKWGGNWRMPTHQEFVDLCRNKNCNWTWTTRNGVYGCVIRGSGAYASNSIFLPAAGCGYGTLLRRSSTSDYDDAYGYYWSSTQATGNSNLSWSLYFYAMNVSSWANRDTFNYERYFGYPIRPVRMTPWTPTGPTAPAPEIINATDIRAPYDVPKAVTVMGAAYDGNGAVVGIVELKLGKVSKGKGKVSGSFVDLDGKKHTIKAVKIEGIDGNGPLSVTLDVKDFGAMNVTIGGAVGGERFAGSLGNWHVQSANVGGDWNGRSATATVNASNLSVFPGTVIGDLLPNEEQATVSNGKWSFAKAATVKLSKDKSKVEWDTSKGKTNLSGLKLTYTPKKGTFKGSFRVFALEGTGKSTKLKKFTIKVSGVVVDGVGYGAATSKKPVVAWFVTVR